MKYSLAIIVIFLFLILAEAQNTSTTPHSSPILQPSVAIIIGVLGLLFFVLLSIFIYTKYCYRNNPDLLSPHHNLRQLLLTRSKFSGIDRSVINSIPFFKFSLLKGSREGLECAVCLSIFEDSEVLRLLPKCKHAFHMYCIDEWLESHSSCPLCRYKFGSNDFSSPIYAGSLRYDGNTSAHHLMNSLNLEFFVEREEQRDGSTRSNFGNNLRKVRKWKDEECIPIKSDVGKKFHKFKHKIVVKDIFLKRRWSDLNSSDLTLLNSEMLSVMSSKRFDSKYNLSLDEQLAKIKEDMEKKRTFEFKTGKLNHTRSDTISPSFGNNENKIVGSKLLTNQRSMSEITILTRFNDLCVQNSAIADSSRLLTDSRDEKIRRLWLPIARRTLQRFAVDESNFDKSDMNMNIHTSNVQIP